MKTLAHIKDGFSLVEVIVAVSIFLIVTLFLTDGLDQYLKSSRNAVPTVSASFLIEESVEVMKTLRDISWDAEIASLTEGTSYHLFWDGSRYVPTTTPYYVFGIFSRTVAVSPVSRDANSDIAAGTDDPDTKKITVTTAWRNGNATTTKVAEAYITNIFDN